MHSRAYHYHPLLIFRHVGGYFSEYFRHFSQLFEPLTQIFLRKNSFSLSLHSLSPSLRALLARSNRGYDPDTSTRWNPPIPYTRELKYRPNFVSCCYLKSIKQTIKCDLPIRDNFMEFPRHSLEFAKQPTTFSSKNLQLCTYKKNIQ